MNELTEQEIVRREKAEKIREMGIDPFGHRFERNAYSKDLKEKSYFFYWNCKISAKWHNDGTCKEKTLSCI